MLLPLTEARHIGLKPCWSAEDCIRLKPQHDSTQRQQVEPQMGNHNSNSPAKLLNSFLPVMYIILMTETMLGWSWTRNRKVRYVRSSEQSHTSFWCKAIYVTGVSEDSEWLAKHVLKRTSGAHSKVCPSLLAWHSTTPKCYWLLYNILAYSDWETLYNNKK